MSSMTDRFDWLVRFLIVRWRFVHQILGILTKTANPKCPTMGVNVVNGNMRLEYNPEFVRELKDPEMVYVMYHEVCHLVLHHCTHRRFSNHLLGNYAQDLAVNELIPTEPGSCEAPKGVLLVSVLQKMPHYDDLKAKQTAEYYYDYLQKKGWGKDNRPQPGGGGQPGKGQSGGKPGEADGKESSGVSGSQRDIHGNKIPDVREIDSHDGWCEDEIADTRVKAEVDQIDKSGMWGNVPADCQAVIMAAQVRRFNWRALVKQFFGIFVTACRESTLRRPNRRMGYLLPGAKRVKQDKHLVAIDTSGSTMGFLPKFLAIVNSMVDYLEIDLVQCDAGIVGEVKPFTRHAKEFTFKGMGGTNFQPIIDLVNEKHYRSVTIVTDGAGPVCTKPNAADVLWCLPEGCTPPVEWGRVVTIDKDR